MEDDILLAAESEKKDDILSKLLPNGWVALATILSFLIIFLVLTFFVWKPIKKLINDRQNLIKNNINGSKKAKEEAFLAKTKALKQIQEAHKESFSIINKGKNEAEVIKQKTIKDALLESKRLLSDAEKLAKEQKEQIKKESKNIIVDLAIETAKKIIKKEISKEQADKIVDEFIKDTTN